MRLFNIAVLQRKKSAENSLMLLIAFTLNEPPLTYKLNDSTDLKNELRGLAKF
jgi:hypothetical protein